MQLASILWPTPRIRSSASSTSTGDRRSLSVHGHRERAFAENDRKRSTELEKVLPILRKRKQLIKLRIADVERYFIFLGKKRLDSRPGSAAELTIFGCSSAMASKCDGRNLE